MESGTVSTGTEVEGSNGGTMTIDNHDHLLKFYDLAGNEEFEKDKTVTLPMSIFPVYITCSKGPDAAAARLATIMIMGKKPVEIIPLGISKAGGVEAKARIELHPQAELAVELDGAGPIGVEPDDATLAMFLPNSEIKLPGATLGR